MSDPAAGTPPPTETPPGTTRVSTRQWITVFAGFAVTLGIVLGIIVSGGKGGSSIHPAPASASPVTTLPFSRFP